MPTYRPRALAGPLVIKSPQIQARSKFTTRIVASISSRLRFLVHNTYSLPYAHYLPRALGGPLPIKPTQAVARGAFKVRPAVIIPTRSRFYVRLKEFAYTRSRFLVRTQEQVQSRSKFLIRVPLVVQARSTFKILSSSVKALILSTRAKFLIRSSVITSSRAKFRIRIPFTAQLRTNFLIRMPLTLPTRAHFLVRLSPTIRLRTRNLIRSAVTVASRLTFRVTAGSITFTPILGKFSRNPLVVRPFSSFQSVLTLTDTGLNPITGIASISVTVLDSDNMTSFYSGTALNGVCSCVYRTGDQGLYREKWIVTLTNGTIYEDINIHAVSY